VNASNNDRLNLNNAVDIGIPITYIDRGNINLNDPTNYYRLRLNENGILNWQLKDFNGNLFIKLIKDLDRDSLVSFDDILEFSLLDTSKASEWFVESGEYFIQIERFSTVTITDYTLQLDFVVDPNVVSIDLDPGNSLSNAFNLGNIATNKIVRESIDFGNDSLDYYRFSLDRNGTLNWQLRDMEDYLYVRLIKDLDGDSLKEYFIEIDRNYSSLNYTLQLDFAPIASAVSRDPGENLSDAFYLGNLTANKTLKEFIGAKDNLDYYQFCLDSNTTVNWKIQDSEDALSVKLIKDIDGDKIVDDREILNYSFLYANEEAEEELAAGEYFLEVSGSYSGTNYTLQLDSNLPAIVTTDRAIFDIDGSGGEPTFARDSLLISAAMFYYKAERSDYTILDNNASRKTGSKVINYLQNKLIVFDVDGSSETTFSFSRDALLISAYMFYYQDDRTDYSILNKFIIDPQATCKTENEIVSYIQDLILDLPTIDDRANSAEITINSNNIIDN
jgi:hypothetical protein